jgi:uncharacterized protein
MDKEATIKLIEEFGQKVIPELPIESIWLYGSWAYGTPDEDSDIDVAVTLADQSLDLLETEQKMFRLRRSIDTRIEPIVIYPGEDRSGFSDMVLEKGIRIYPASDV